MRAAHQTFAGAIRTDAALVAGAAALLGACVLQPGAVDAGPIVCPFRLATGLPCPACGSIRAWTAFAHGDLNGAIGHNPFAVMLMVATAIAIGWRVTSHIRPNSIRHVNLESVARHPISVGVLALWMVWGTVRAAGVVG